MKKIIVCFLVFMLLTVGVNSFFVEGITIEEIKQNNLKINIKEYDYINPSFYKTWEHKDFGAAFGYKSIVYNGNIYQIVRLGQKEGYVVLNDTVCIVKYDANTGKVLNFDILTEEITAGPEALIQHKNQIYVLGTHTDRKEENNNFVLKYDLDLKLENIYYIFNSNDYRYSPLDMVSDNENIYITGTVKKNEEDADRDIFVAKFDSNLGLVWNTSWDYERKNQDLTWTGSIITTYGNYVYVTGCLSSNDDGFLLKISKKDGISDFVITENVYEGCAVDAANEQIYVAYPYSINGGSNIKLCAYDINLNLTWCEILDIAKDDIVEDILVSGDSIYITGTVVEIDPSEPLNPMLSNAYILKYNLLDNCEDWTKLVKEKTSYGFSINADDNNLYLSGAIVKIIGLRLYSFVLKCTKEGKIKSKILNHKKIDKNKFFLSFFNKMLVDFPDLNLLFKNIIDFLKITSKELVGCRS